MAAGNTAIAEWPVWGGWIISKRKFLLRLESQNTLVSGRKRPHRSLRSLAALCVPGCHSWSKSIGSITFQWKPNVAMRNNCHNYA